MAAYLYDSHAVSILNKDILAFHNVCLLWYTCISWQSRLQWPWHDLRFHVFCFFSHRPDSGTFLWIYSRLLFVWSDEQMEAKTTLGNIARRKAKCFNNLTFVLFFSSNSLYIGLYIAYVGLLWVDWYLNWCCFIACRYQIQETGRS